MPENGENKTKKKKREPSTNSKSRSPSKTRKAVEGTHPTTTTPAIGKRIRVYRNGDPYHKGINVVLNMKHAHDINAFLDAISERIGLVSGVKRLYTLNGNQVKSTNALENNHEYVASSGGFMPLNYGEGYKQKQSAFLPKRDESSFSLGSSKRSLPTRMSRSSTELRSTSRDLSVRSLNSNGPHSAKSNVSTLSNHSGQNANKTTTKRAKSLVTNKRATAEHKPTHPHHNKENEHQKDEKPKKKRVKKSPTHSPKPKPHNETHQQNGNTTPKRKVKKKKSTEAPKQPDVVIGEKEIHQAEHHNELNGRPSTRNESRMSAAPVSSSHGNRPPSRHSSRASTAGKRPETVESHKSHKSHRESEAEHIEHPEHLDRHEQHLHDEGHNEHHHKSESEHHESRPETPRSGHSAHSHKSEHHHEKTEESDAHHTADEHSRPASHHEHHSNEAEANEHHNGVTDTSEDENSQEEDRKSNDQNSSKQHNVPLEAL